MRSIITTTCVCCIFDIRDLRSGQLRDLPKLSQWAKFQLPLFRIGTFPFARNCVTLGHQWRPRCKYSLVTPKRAFEVTRGHQSFFANNFWFRKDGDVRVVSLCSSYQEASSHMQYDLLGSYPSRSYCGPSDRILRTPEICSMHEPPVNPRYIECNPSFFFRGITRMFTYLPITTTFEYYDWRSCGIP